MLSNMVIFFSFIYFRMHRLFVVKESGIYDKEKDFCDSYIMLDNKNIHAWTYRLTIVETYNLWEDELDYTDSTTHNLFLPRIYYQGCV